MTKHIPTGGPAFPIECNIVNGFRDDTGMTLRDWFAGQALAGICANSAWNETFHASVMRPSAQAAYAMADAMLAEKFKADEINEQARKEAGDDLPW